MQTDLPRWSDSQSLSESWDGRAKVAAQFIPDGATVLDVGCGRMALEKMLMPGCRYIPADLVKRDDRTIIVELNAGLYPEEAAHEADVITLLGVVEYIVDPQLLFRWLRSHDKPVVVSYHPAEMTGRLDRRSLGWINHFDSTAWKDLVARSGMRITASEKLSDIQVLYRLDPDRGLATPPCRRVTVVSYLNVGNFGDRLGYHLLQSVLPPHAIVEHRVFKPWLPQARQTDLLVLGIGNSIFDAVMTDELQALLDSVPRAIGIFGTQYRERIDRNRLRRILERLDTWYARSSEDLLLYGSMAKRAVHLGDWLIDAFPMAEPTIEGAVSIGQEIWQDLPLDRTIQSIQQYRAVISSRLHPLLCALTSASTVQYSEQRESGSNIESGKFRSLLMDVFGRTFPENTPIKVDRQRVVDYKAHVSREVGKLRSDLAALLTS
jgi:hypothetical protein